MFQRLRAYAHLMRWHRPIGSLLLLWPTLWALWIANQGIPPLKLLLVFIAGTFIMRSAGCVINDIADRNFDGLVERTKTRPLATGQVSVKEALILFGLLCIIALFLVLQLNSYTIKLAMIGLLLAIIYPFMKRFTHWPQFILGLAFSWGVPMAFAASIDRLPLITGVLFASGLVWALIYDTQYAMIDREDDLKIGIKSTAILFGRFDKLVIAMLQVVMLNLLIIVGIALHVSTPYFISLIGVLILFIYQGYLIKDRAPALCFKAFLNNNWVGLIILVGLVYSTISPYIF